MSLIGKKVKARTIKKTYEGIILDKYQGISEVTIMQNRQAAKMLIPADHYLLQTNNGLITVECGKVLEVFETYLPTEELAKPNS